MCLLHSIGGLNMKVIALVGPSGTGKSHHAFSVARKFNTELIIDDGLLIHGARLLPAR